MSRRFITLILASATALSLASTQARALSTEDLAKVAGGVALIFILKQAADAAERDRKEDQKNRHRKAEEERLRHEEAARRARHTSRRVLPAECRHAVDLGHRRDAIIYGKHCLERNFAGLRALPAQCSARVAYKGRQRPVYFEKCLDRYGFETPRR